MFHDYRLQLSKINDSYIARDEQEDLRLLSCDITYSTHEERSCHTDAGLEFKMCITHYRTTTKSFLSIIDILRKEIKVELHTIFNLKRQSRKQQIPNPVHRNISPSILILMLILKGSTCTEGSKEKPMHIKERHERYKTPKSNS